MYERGNRVSALIVYKNNDNLSMCDLFKFRGKQVGNYEQLLITAKSKSSAILGDFVRGYIVGRRWIKSQYYMVTFYDLLATKLPWL